MDTHEIRTPTGLYVKLLGIEAERLAQDPEKYPFGTQFIEKDTGLRWIAGRPVWSPEVNVWVLEGGGAANVAQLDVWISATGDDAADGTSTRPILSVPELARRMPAGYQRHCRIHHDGTTLPPITAPLIFRVPSPLPPEPTADDGLAQPEPVLWLGTQAAPLGGVRQMTLVGPGRWTLSGAPLPTLVPYAAAAAFADCEGMTLRNLKTTEERMVWANTAGDVFTTDDFFLAADGDDCVLFRPASAVVAQELVCFFGASDALLMHIDVKWRQEADAPLLALGGVRVVPARAEYELVSDAAGLLGIENNSGWGSEAFPSDLAPAFFSPEQYPIGGYSTGISGPFPNGMFAFGGAKIHGPWVASKLNRISVNQLADMSLVVPHCREVGLVAARETARMSLFAFDPANPGRIDAGQVLVGPGATAAGNANIKFTDAPADPLTIDGGHWSPARLFDASVLDGGGNLGTGIRIRRAGTFAGTALDTLTGTGGDIALGDHTTEHAASAFGVTADGGGPATTVDLAGWSHPELVGCDVTARVIARLSDGTHVATFRLGASTRRPGGGGPPVVEQTGLAVGPVTDPAGPLAVLAVPAFVVVGNRVVLRATGLAGLDLEWRVLWSIGRSTGGAVELTHADVWSGLGGPGSATDAEGDTITEVTP